VLGVGTRSNDAVGSCREEGRRTPREELHVERRGADGKRESSKRSEAYGRMNSYGKLYEGRWAVETAGRAGNSDGEAGARDQLPREPFTYQHSEARRTSREAKGGWQHPT